MPKKTPWFSGDVKPVRNGPYEVMANGHESVYVSWFAKNRFHGCWFDADEAKRALDVPKGNRCWSAVSSWRGLTKEAK